MVVFRRLLATLTWGSVVVTLLSLIRHPHWFFRVWDFPRAQIAAVGLGAAALWQSLFRAKRPQDRIMTAAAVAAAAWQASKILPYTPLWRPRSLRATRVDPAATFSMMISNVLSTNREYHRFLEVVRANDPDIVLAVETDDAWMEAISGLNEIYPHRIAHPLDNFYGIALLSKLELVDPAIMFLVQDDIPSVHTGVRLRNGVVIRLHGIHPRPPEPLRNQRSSPRDAELVVMGKEIERHPEIPAIVSGDLNDVAWSETSELFVRLSGLLDPRIGRGLYNSFDANNPIMRYPLDHVFHSVHFRLVDLQRLPHIGSDHFPLLIRLMYDPTAPAEQEAPEKEDGDDEQAAERLEQQAEDAATGADRPNDD